jgi:hypothetical protein
LLAGVLMAAAFLAFAPIFDARRTAESVPPALTLSPPASGDPPRE